jgi:glyoxylase-like metal-dependent hydrolase (beta-lactamase superfamily II)
MATSRDDATYLAHEDTASQLTRSNDPNRPVPTVTFSDSYTLEMGNQTLELDYKGPNHEAGNIFIYAPQQKVLMLVDVIFPGWAPFMNLALAEDIPGFIQTHDDVLAYDFEVFIGGHLGRYGSREDVEIQREYIMDIRANAAEALQTVDFFAIAQQTGFENPWLLFDTYFNTLAEACAEATVPDWVDRLGGADVWTDEHCKVMAESLRIDYFYSAS